MFLSREYYINSNLSPQVESFFLQVFFKLPVFSYLLGPFVFNLVGSFSNSQPLPDHNQRILQIFEVRQLPAVMDPLDYALFFNTGIDGTDEVAA